MINGMMPQQGPLVETPESLLQEADLLDAIQAVDRKRLRFQGLFFLMLLILSWVLVEAPPGAATGAAVLAILSTKRAFREYRALAESKRTLLNGSDDASGLVGPEA